MSEWRLMVRKYLLHLQSGGYSNGMLEASARWIKSFLAWCEERGLSAPADVRAEDVEAFRQFLCHTPGRRCDVYSAQSIDQALRLLRPMFRWALKREYILFDPTADLVLPGLSRPAPQVPTMNDVRRMLRASDDGTMLGLRDRAVLETFYGTGMRKLELLQLDLKDVDMHDRKIRVFGKGSYERFVPIGDTLADVLERYLRDCRLQLAGRMQDPALFLSANGTRFSPNGMAELIRRLAKRVGLKLSAHTLRHAFAVHLLKCGADFYDVSHLLGHRDPSSTEIYTHIAMSTFGRQFRRCHPRGRRITRPSSQQGGERA